MSIGTAFGRIAGTNAAKAALEPKQPVALIHKAQAATKTGANHASA
jgi:tricarballylate dehydrogenase